MDFSFQQQGITAESKTSWPLEKETWNRIFAAFCGPIRYKVFLIIVKSSKWVEAIEMKNMTTK